MTAREHIAGYESRLREYSNFAVRGVKKVCKECGPRPPTSPAELKAQEMMRRDLETCCDELRMEQFKTAPGAFMGWVRLDVVCGFLAAAAYNLGYAVVSLALLLFAVVMMVLEFLMYKQALDAFLPKKTSQNLIGVQKPAGEVKRRLILCGHADSAFEWRFTYLGHKWFNNTRLLTVVILVCVVSMLFGLGISAAAVAMGQGWVGLAGLGGRGGTMTLLGYVFAGLCVPFSLGWFFENKKLPVVGANDNLSGCFTAMAVAKLLGETNSRLENTELVILCSGSEELGLRGAKAFVKAHAESFKDVETVFVALDTMTDFDHMAIYIRDLTSTVAHDPAVSAMIRKAANTAGHDVPYEFVPVGASDAVAATQAGIRASAFAAMDPKPAHYYHTRLDTVDELQPKTVEACLDIFMELAHQFDETGLAPFEGSVVKKTKK